MNEYNELSFKFALEATKQMITLATGVITLTITFARDYLVTFDPEFKKFAIAGWILFIFSVVCGQFTLLALTGSLCNEKPSIIGWNVRIPSILQIISFLMGLGVVVLFAIKAKVLGPL